MNTQNYKPYYIYLTIFAIILVFVGLFRDAAINQAYYWDANIHTWATGVRNPVLTKIMIIISDIGMIGGTFIIGFVMAYLFFYRKIHVLFGLLLSSIGAGLFTYFMKLVIARDRPEIVNRLVTESGFSFPSGHSTTAFVAFPILSAVIYFDTKMPFFAKSFLILGLISFSFGVSFSRVYLGVHYFSDVVAGAVVGITASSVFLYFHSNYYNYDSKH